MHAIAELHLQSGQAYALQHFLSKYKSLLWREVCQLLQFGHNFLVLLRQLALICGNRLIGLPLHLLCSSCELALVCGDSLIGLTPHLIHPALGLACRCGRCIACHDARFLTKSSQIQLFCVSLT